MKSSVHHRPTRWRRHVALMVAAALTVLVGLTAAPAHACACGAAEPAGDKELGIHSETAVVVHDGQREQIAISLGLNTDSPELAFLMPVPTKAEVALADEDLFKGLASHTRPEVTYRNTYFNFDGGDSGGAPEGAPTGGPTVLGRQQVGQYDVVQLSGDRDAVGTWLTDNGFRTRDGVLDVLGSYLSDGWAVMAVKLAFEPGEEFSGDLEPLLLDFPSDELVYPMKLSSLVTGEQEVELYVFAPHRVDGRIGDLSMTTTYAGAETAESLGARAPAAADLLGDRSMWLTRLEVSVGPGDVTADMSFPAAQDGDEPYRKAVVVTRDRTDVTIGVLIIAGIFLGGVAVGWVGRSLLTWRQRRTEAAR